MTTNEQILEQQVEALEKLLQLRRAVIEELEAKISRLEASQTTYTPNPYWINVPYVNPYPGYYGPGGAGGGGMILGGQSGTVTITSNTCPGGTPHQYPSAVSGTGSACCTKCNQSIGYTTAVTTIGGGITSTTGYISPVTSVTTSADGISQVNQYGGVQGANVLTLTNIAK